jgi:putative membrane protein
MKTLEMHLKRFAYGGSLLVFGAIWAVCIAPRAALSQSPSPADGQTKGAAINDSINGTTPIPNPADQLGNMGGVNAGQQAAIDKMFVKKAIQGNLVEVQLGQLTLQKSSNDQVKQFAQKMIDDHTMMNERLMPIVQQLRVEAPTEISKKDKSLISKMQALSGPAYDQAYIKDMVKDHKDDLSAFHTEVSNGQYLAVKNAAAEASTTIAKHLEMAQQLAKDQNIDLAKK